MDPDITVYRLPMGPLKTQWLRDLVPILQSPVVRAELPYLYCAFEDTWFVLRAGGEVVAFAAITPQRDRRVRSPIYVLPQHRRRGYARRCVARLVQWAQAMGFPVAKATTAPAAVGVLLSLGFRATGRRGQYTLMRLDLAP